MKEIGGYIEFETFHSAMLYDDGIKLCISHRKQKYQKNMLSEDDVRFKR